jgi:hypothetical protein
MNDLIYLIYIGLFVVTVIYLSTFGRSSFKNIISKGPIVTTSEATYSN